MEFFEYPLLHYPDLMLALLREGERGEAGLNDALGRLEAELSRADEKPPVSREEALARLGVARQRLVEAGLLDDRGEGRYAITERGRKALAEHPDGIDDTVLMGYEEFRAAVSRRAAHDEPEDAAGTAFRQGYSAFLAAQPHAANPHREDTAAHNGWENGWFAGRDEARAHPTPEEKYGGRTGPV